MTLFGGHNAVFSADRAYRYLLVRSWDITRPTLCMVMLNPSTADETQNDPTVERCVRRAMSMGMGELRVVNLFAVRSTDPKLLYSHHAPVGDINDLHICRAASLSAIVICAWGTHGSHLGRGPSVAAMLRAEFPRKLYVLKLNADGSPKHPLYVGYAQSPVPWCSTPESLEIQK